MKIAAHAPAPQQSAVFALAAHAATELNRRSPRSQRGVAASPQNRSRPTSEMPPAQQRQFDESDKRSDSIGREAPPVRLRLHRERRRGTGASPPLNPIVERSERIITAI